MKFRILSIFSSIVSSLLPLTIFSSYQIDKNYKALTNEQFLKTNNNAQQQNNFTSHNFWSIIFNSGSFSFLRKLIYQLDINPAQSTTPKKTKKAPQELFITSENLYSGKLQSLMNKFLQDLSWVHLVAPIEEQEENKLASQEQTQQNNLAQHFDSFKEKFFTVNNWIEASILFLVLLAFSSLLLSSWVIFIALDKNISRFQKIKKISYHLITQFPGWLIFYFLEKKRLLKKNNFPSLEEENEKYDSSFKLKNINFHVDSYSILKDINCILEKNEFYSIIGPNGAGKTTFLKHLGGILKPNSGKLYLGKEELENINSKSFWKKTVYIPQELNIQSDTPVYDFLLYSRYSSISRIQKVSNEDHIKTLEVIKAAGIEHLRWNRMGELSGGQRQKVILASILMKDVELILMDEPTTFLDVQNRNFFISFLKKLHLSGKTIIANLHNFTEISNLSTKIIALKDGKIFKLGNKSEILKADTLNQLYDLNLSSDNWESLLSLTSSNY